MPRSNFSATCSGSMPRSNSSATRDWMSGPRSNSSAKSDTRPQPRSNSSVSLVATQRPQSNSSARLDTHKAHSTTHTHENHIQCPKVCAMILWRHNRSNSRAIRRSCGNHLRINYTRCGQCSYDTGTRTVQCVGATPPQGKVIGPTPPHRASLGATPRPEKSCTPTRRRHLSQDLGHGRRQVVQVVLQGRHLQPQGRLDRPRSRCQGLQCSALPLAAR